MHWVLCGLATPSQMLHSWRICLQWAVSVWLLTLFWFYSSPMGHSCVEHAMFILDVGTIRRFFWVQCVPASSGMFRLEVVDASRSLKTFTKYIFALLGQHIIEPFNGTWFPRFFQQGYVLGIKRLDPCPTGLWCVTQPKLRNGFVFGVCMPWNLTIRLRF